MPERGLSSPLQRANSAEYHHSTRLAVLEHCSGLESPRSGIGCFVCPPSFLNVCRSCNRLSEDTMLHRRQHRRRGPAHDLIEHTRSLARSFGIRIQRVRDRLRHVLRALDQIVHPRAMSQAAQIKISFGSRTAWSCGWIEQPYHCALAITAYMDPVFNPSEKRLGRPALRV